ncbi:hypothetical protein BGZ54_008813 [Gamsiella multidivaricata]|nr:hypothetical protein BGZ54_008813 [Gamsiella multidivaricata]
MSNNAQDRMAQEDNSSGKRSHGRPYVRDFEVDTLARKGANPVPVRVTSVRIGAASASADITSTAPSNNIEVRQVEDANSSNKRRPRERSTRLGLKRRGKYRPRKPKAWLRLFMDPNSLSPVGDDNADKSGDDDDDDDERPAKRSKSINKQYGPRLLDKDGNPWLLDPPVMEYPYLQEAFPYEEYKTPENRVETTTYGTMPNPLPDAWYAPQSPFITRDFFSIKKFEYAKKLFKAIEVNTADLRMDIYYQRGFELASKRMLDRVRAEKWKALETRNGPSPDSSSSKLDEPTLTDYYQVNTYLAQLFVPMVKNDPIPLSPAAYRILQTMMMGMENKIIAMGCQRQRAELTARLSKVDAKSRRKDLRQYRRPKIVDVDEWIFGYPFNRREDEEEYLRDRKKQEEAMALRPGQRPAFVSNPLEIPLEMEPFHQARERMQKWKK